MAISEVEAVNSILVALGEAPVTSIASPQGALVASATEALGRHRVEVCSRPYFFNTVERTLSPNGSGRIALGPTVLDVLPRAASDRHRYTIRDGSLYDLVDDTDQFTGDVTLRVVEELAFEELPQAVRAYVAASALMELVGAVADTSVAAVAQSRYLKAQADFARHVRPAGRYSFFDPATRSRFWRL